MSGLILAGSVCALALMTPDGAQVPSPPPERPIVQSNAAAKTGLQAPPLRTATASIAMDGAQAPEADDEAAAAMAPGPPPASPEAEVEASPPAEIEDTASTAEPAPALIAASSARQPGSLKPAFRGELDSGLAPLLNYAISSADIERVKDAVKLVYKDEFQAARALMAQIDDKTAKKLVHWYILRASGIDAPYQEVARFREANPLWPSKTALDASIETGILFRETDPAKIIAFFKNTAPQTGAGKAALGGALLASADAEGGKALIREAWRRHLFDGEIEAKIRERHGAILTESDHKSRLLWLMAKDPKKRAASIQRLRRELKEEVPPPDAAKAAAPAKTKPAKAREAEKKAKTAKTANPAQDKKTAAMPPAGVPAAAAAAAAPDKAADEKPAVYNPKEDVTQLLIRVKDARKKKQRESAWQTLRSIPAKAIGPLEAEDWWEEQRMHVRAAVTAGSFQAAHEMAANHGQLTGELHSEAEFLAGWTALRFLNKPAKARDHLIAAAAAGGLPKDRSRAGYWLGRAYLALGDKNKADAAFENAAAHAHTFYAQLAAHALGRTGAAQFRMPHSPSKEELRRFAAMDVMQAIVIAHKADLNTILPVFLFDLARGVTDEAQMGLAGELALRLAPLPITVRFAKIAINRGYAVDHYGFPPSLPAPPRLMTEEPVENALLHALTRQESEFNPSIVSPAKARGLMQLLPSTAKMVARTHSIKFDAKKLDEPEYNVRLGTAFIQEMVDDYGGSYIMALAAYNAGPGRVRQWVREFGDPRQPGVDPLDWIERIPFTETRDYVHKIMESLQMYRARFAESGGARHLAQDVHRGRPGAKPYAIRAGAAN